MYRNVFIKKKFALFAMGPVFWNKLSPSKLMFNAKNSEVGLQENHFGPVRIERHKYNYKINSSDFKFLLRNIGIAFNTFLFLIMIFKSKNKAKCENLSKPYLGCSLRSKDDGMQIILIKSDSPADKAGLQNKDIILEVDGNKISSINDYNAAIGSEANIKQLKILRIIDNREIILYIDVNYVYL